MLNKSFTIIMFGLLLILVVSVTLHFDVQSPILHPLLAIGFIAIGVGALLGFIKMISDDNAK